MKKGNAKDDHMICFIPAYSLRNTAEPLVSQFLSVKLKLNIGFC